MAEIKWIKITTTMFEDEKIDFIESLPEADAILIIWIKLLTLAGKCNANGYICLTDTIQYDENMLAHKFKRPVNTVKLALQTFERLGMIERTEQGFYISNWEKHQNIEGMDRIREQTKLRNQKYREKKKQVLLDDVKCDVTHDVSETSNDETELDIDKDINNINIINNILPEKNEIIDEVVDKSVDNLKVKNKTVSKNIHGEFEKVKLTDEEHVKLIEKLGETATKDFIVKLDGYKASTGKIYKSDYATILNWSRKEPVKQQQNKQKPNTANKFHNFPQKIAAMGESKLEEMVRKRWS